MERIDNYNDWLPRFETALRALPEKLRQASVLAILEPYRHPAGNPIAEWRDGRVVLVPPDQIED
jgi:hypothetical protein